MRLPSLIVRPLAPLLAVAALAGCGTWAAPVAVLSAASFGPVPVIQRTPGDVVASVLTGRDCSIVRLDKQESYCKEPELPRRQPYCTRSLGVVDCWIDPQAVRPTPPDVADAPSLTAQQLMDLHKTWLQRELGL